MASRNTEKNQYGTVRIEHCDYWDEPCPILRKAIKVADSASICRWRPADEISDQVPNNFELKFLCLKGKDSVRRFLPVTEGDALLANLFAGGLAILNRDQELSGAYRWSYRMMFLFFQRVKKFSNHCKRNLGGPIDLIIKRTGRGATGRRTVLPENLGIPYSEEGEPWSITRLQTEGELLAKENGVENPNRQETLNYGFYAAAKASPIRITESKEIESLIRIALYNEQNTVPCDPECQHWIEDRILAALEKHQHDSQEEFDNWFSGPKNSFLTQISKQKCPFGKLNNDMIRWALLELGWKAYHYVGNCIHMQMRCFQNALPSPLNESERNIFEMAYMKQDYLGDFPLLLLKERLPFLTAPMLSVLSGDDDFDFVGTIHRLLYYYSDMTDIRRDADRRTQFISKVCRPYGGVSNAYKTLADKGRLDQILGDSRDDDGLND